MNNCIHIVSLLVKLHRNCAECMVGSWTMNIMLGVKKKKALYIKLLFPPPIPSFPNFAKFGSREIAVSSKIYLCRV